MEDVAIRALTSADREAALEVINTAARWFAEFLPPEEVRDPEMTPEQWEEESRRMTWYGGFFGGRLVAVTGLEYVRDVALLRHGYVLPEHQRSGIGTAVGAHVVSQIAGARRVITGTYASNHKARAMLERAGFHLSADPEAVLRAYYSIPEDRLRASVTYEHDL